MPGGFYSRAEIEGIVNRIRSSGLVSGQVSAAGKVFFVDGRYGSDSNPPDDPARPLNTITNALSLCKDWRDDYIIVLNFGPGEASFPVVVDKHRVHIIAVDSGGAKHVGRIPGDDTAIFLVGRGRYFEIAGFQFGGGATHGCIEYDPDAVAGDGRGLIHHCWFGTMYAAQDGIKIPATQDAVEIDVVNCRFGPFLTRDGIRAEGNSTRSVFRNNIFRKVGGIGIHCMKSGSDIGAIIGNHFQSAPGGAAGFAITMESGVGSAMIDDNHAAEDGEEPGNNPYRDLSTGLAGTTLNAWGLNYMGILATYPVFV